MKEECIFCKIIRGELPSCKLYEDKESLAFLDINPVNYGHVLLIPKKHYKMMFDVPDGLLAEMFIKTKELMQVIKDAMDADYVSVSVVGVDVPHFHIHVIPRYHDDGMSDFWPTKKYEEGKIEEIARKIRNSIQ